MTSSFRFRPYRILYLLSMSLIPFSASALPEGGIVQSGKARFDTLEPGMMTITNNPKTIIDWKDFSTRLDETVRFVQHNSHSAVLNRVVGENPSTLLGQMSSNGRVFLINPNGVIFGEGSRIDTAGFLASTLNIGNQDFKDGHYLFIQEGRGQIENRGQIEARQGGNIVLLSPSITHTGTLRTDSGHIILAAGEKLSLSKLDDPEIRFEIQSPKDQVINLGTMLTGSGGVIEVFTGTLQNQGTLEARGVGLDSEGRIVLSAEGDIGLAAGSRIASFGAGADTIRLTSQNGVIKVTDDTPLDAATAPGSARGVVLDAHGGSIDASTAPLSMQGGILRLESSTQVGDLDFQAGTLVLGNGGKLDVNRRFDWMEGKLTGSATGRLELNPDAPLNFDGSAIRVLNGPTLSTAGFTLNEGGLNLHKGTLLTTGALTLAQNTELHFSGGDFPFGVLNNAGLVRIESPNQTVKLQDGQHSGTFLIQRNASLAFEGKPHFTSGSDVMGDGKLGFTLTEDNTLPQIAVDTLHLASTATVTQSDAIEARNLELQGGRYDFNADNRIANLSGAAQSLDLKTRNDLTLAGLNLGESARFDSQHAITQTAGLSTPSLELAGNAQVILTDTGNRIGRITGQVDSLRLLDHEAATPGAFTAENLQATGNMELANHGATTTSGVLSSREGRISVTAHSPLTVGGKIEAEHDVELAAGEGEKPDDTLRFEEHTELASRRGNIGMAYHGELLGARPSISAPYGRITYNGLEDYKWPDSKGDSTDSGLPPEIDDSETRKTLETIDYTVNNQTVVLVQQSPGAAASREKGDSVALIPQGRTLLDDTPTDKPVKGKPGKGASCR